MALNEYTPRPNVLLIVIDDTGFGHLGCYGSPIWPEAAPPFEFTGKVNKVTVDVSGDVIKDDAAAMRAVMARQ